MISHFELFHVGQARLARYPIHFHFDKDFNYRAEKYGETNPQARFCITNVLFEQALKALKQKSNLSQSIAFQFIMQIVDF